MCRISNVSQERSDDVGGTDTSSHTIHEIISIHSQMRVWKLRVTGRIQRSLREFSKRPSSRGSTIASDSCGSPSSDGPSPPEQNERRDSLRVGTHRLPAYLALVSLAVRSQLPDLVDKPLAYLDILTYGQSLS